MASHTGCCGCWKEQHAWVYSGRVLLEDLYLQIECDMHCVTAQSMTLQPVDDHMSAKAHMQVVMQCSTANDRVSTAAEITQQAIHASLPY
mgnify:CR=1